MVTETDGKPLFYFYFYFYLYFYPKLTNFPTRLLRSPPSGGAEAAAPPAAPLASPRLRGAAPASSRWGATVRGQPLEGGRCGAAVRGRPRALRPLRSGAGAPRGGRGGRRQPHGGGKGGGGAPCWHCRGEGAGPCPEVRRCLVLLTQGLAFEAQEQRGLAQTPLPR